MTDELKSMVFQVITSWQVIAVTVVLVLYFSLVFYVAQFNHNARAAGDPKIKRQPKPKKEKRAPAKDADDDEDPGA